MAHLSLADLSHSKLKIFHEKTGSRFCSFDIFKSFGIDFKLIKFQTFTFRRT